MEGNKVGPEAAGAGNLSARSPLPKAFTYTSPTPSLHYQGAEALLYKTYYLSYPSPDAQTPSLPAALKHRPPKPYRHPYLDAKLTRHRILSEARVLAKLKKEGVSVPALYALDWEGGWIMMEWVDGSSIRSVLDVELGPWLDTVAGDEEAVQSSRLWRLMGSIGNLVGKMHQTGTVHGDLTTSNLLLRSDRTIDVELMGEVVLIDFGLASQGADVEDRAVDLYVLERAFGSTHPGTEKLFGEVLRAYGQSYKGAKPTLKRYEDVRMRGRKKIALG